MIDLQETWRYLVFKNSRYDTLEGPIKRVIPWRQEIALWKDTYMFKPKLVEGREAVEVPTFPLHRCDPFWIELKRAECRKREHVEVLEEEKAVANNPQQGSFWRDEETT